MRYGLSLLLLLAWGLWFGGQVTLVILIVALFRSDRSTAVRAGPFPDSRAEIQNMLTGSGLMRHSQHWPFADASTRIE